MFSRIELRCLVIVSLCALLALVATARAESITYEVKDLATFTGSSGMPAVGQSFTGTGFVCMSGPPGPSIFWHVFGFGGTARFRTDIQVNIAGIANMPVQQAVLSFVLKEEGHPVPQDVTFTSYPSTGTIAFTEMPPGNLGSITTPVTGPSPGNPSFVSVDVTSLLAPRVAAGEEWFGLYITGSDLSATGTYGTYTFVPGNPITTLVPDAAQVRLAVTFIPEPACLAAPFSLLGLSCYRAQGCRARRDARRGANFAS